MNVLAVLIPVSVGLGLLGLGAFVWLLRRAQFEDPEGTARRILIDRWDDSPPTGPADPVSPGKMPPVRDAARKRTTP